MRKCKCKKIIINNNVNEIDYDKLADAIVKAQEINEDKANQKHRFTSGSFAMLITVAFRVFSAFVGLLAVLMLVAPVVSWSTLQWNSFTNIVTSIVTIVFCIVFTTVLGVYTILLWKSANEIETEKDRNYIISVFSGIVSFAALIVALVALFKGVG